MKRLLKIVGALALILLLAFVGYVAYRLTPQQLDLPLPEKLVAIDTDAGRVLLESSDHAADYAVLAKTWEGQQLVSYCGVASGVAVVNALGQSANQFNFFNEYTDSVRSRVDVTFGGMSLPDLAGLLEARGLEVSKLHGDEVSLEEFRDLVKSNLSREEDYLLVNYQREVLGQGRVGHISPVGAYNAFGDQILILDTADFKYPHTWVPLAALYAAMQEKDSASGRARGLVEVRMPGT
jgi:hypothetical protein